MTYCYAFCALVIYYCYCSYVNLVPSFCCDDCSSAMKCNCFVCSGMWQEIVSLHSKVKLLHSDETFRMICTRMLTLSTETRWYSLEYANFVSMLLIFINFTLLIIVQGLTKLVIKLSWDWSHNWEIYFAYSCTVHPKLSWLYIDWDWDNVVTLW